MNSRGCIYVFVGYSVIVALFLLGPARLIVETRGDALSVGDSFQRAGVLVGIVTILLGVPALILLAIQVQDAFAKPILSVELAPHPPPPKPERTYHIDLILRNISPVSAQHFRLLVCAHQPLRADENAGVTFHDRKELGVPGRALDWRQEEHAAKLLPVDPPPSMQLAFMWELRVTDHRLYSQDRFPVLQISSSLSELVVDWRVDSEGGTRRGRSRLLRADDVSAWRAAST